MIKNIIFDFGDVFINLDKEIIFREIEKFGGRKELGPEILKLNESYEIGEISSDDFIAQLATVYPKAKPQEIITVWNSMLLDFPDYRLEFVENLANEKKYRLFLLSNTNALHIPHVSKIMGIDRFNRFKSSFEQFYLSHEIQLRKPNSEIYQFVLDKNGLRAEETFFVDDNKENIEAAKKMGIQCWNLEVGKEDIINLISKL